MSERPDAGGVLDDIYLQAQRNRPTPSFQRYLPGIFGNVTEALLHKATD